MSLDMALLFISYVLNLIIGFSMIAYKIHNAPIGHLLLFIFMLVTCSVLGEQQWYGDLTVFENHTLFFRDL